MTYCSASLLKINSVPVPVIQFSPASTLYFQVAPVSIFETAIVPFLSFNDKVGFAICVSKTNAKGAVFALVKPLTVI